MPRTTAKLAVLAIELLLAGSAAAQSVSLRVLADWGDQYRPRGDWPALHSGTVAFLGDESGPEPTLWAVFRGSLDGAMPFQPVAFGRMADGDPVPWRTDGSWFVGFNNPVVWNDQVLFDADRSPNGTGTFAEGGILSTPSGYSRFGASIGFPSPGALGLVQPASFRRPDQTIIQVIPINAPLPGGGTSATTSAGRTSGVVEGAAYGGDRAVYITRVNTPTGTDYGIYSWLPDNPVAPIAMVANPWTVFPGTNRLFEYFTGVDTDGARVSFNGSSGIVGQSGIAGIFTAVLAPDGTSQSIAPLAVTAQVSPFGAPFAAFGATAVDGPVVCFDATIGSLTSGSYAAFASHNGVVLPIFKTGDVIDGKIMADGRINHRALDRNDLIMWARYQLPGAPGGVGVMLLHVHINPPTPCPADFTRDGALSVQDVFDFLDAYFSGIAQADFNGIGGVTVQDVFDFLDAWFAGC